jgi:hypothetical protein
VDADGEVDARAAEGSRRVEVAAWQVEAVTRDQGLLDEWRTLSCLFDSGLPAGPRLVTQRQLVHRRADLPPLLTGDLQDEHVVDVVVVAEALVLRWCDIGVDLHGVAELTGERLGELDDRAPGPVQPLEHEGRALGEVVQHGVVTHLVRDGRTDPPTAGEAAVLERRAVARHAQEGRAQAAARDELVDRVGGEQVVERLGQVFRAVEQRLARPVAVGELCRRYGEESRQHRVPSAGGGHPVR